MVRYHIFVEGRVQGVGFRYFVLMHAQSYGLTGSVKNLDNGLVEIYVQGESDTIDQFLATIIKGDGRKELVNGITFSLDIDFYQTLI